MGEVNIYKAGFLTVYKHPYLLARYYCTLV